MNDRFKFKYFYDDKLREVIGINFESEYVTIRISEHHTITTMLKPEKLIQCTGLKDKNGKLIYEGDILLSSDVEEPYMITIEWNNENCGFIIKAWNGKEFEYALTDDEIEDIKHFEINGNIYENPELLGAQC